jgi:hypothetical protein
MSRNVARPVSVGVVPSTGLAVFLFVAVTAAGCGHADDRGTPAGIRFTRIDSGPAVAPARSSPSATWIDYDGDGDDDLYVLNGYGSLEEEPVPQPDGLYRNDGTGRFMPVLGHPLVEDPTFSGSGTWGDYDDDGDLDLFVANQRGADNRLYRNEGGGDFRRVLDSPAVHDGGRSFSALWVDIDGDGRLDLHVQNGRDGNGGQVDFVYRNRGDGELERVLDVPFAGEALPSGGAAWGDHDRDGDPDLFLPVYASGEPNRLYRNDGGWAFTEVAAEAGLAPHPLPFSPPTSVARWVDHDSDGDLDLFVGNTRGTIDFLYENDGSGHFRRSPAGRLGLDATYVSDATWADLDNDADLDLVVAVWGGASELWLNDGRGGLRPADGGQLDDSVGFASSVSAADADGDGDLDLYLTQWPIDEAGGAPNRLYRNDGAGGHWLQVRLDGTAGGGPVTGATVRVTATIGGEERTQLRRLTSRTSWRSAGSRTLHFGLAGAESVHRIEVQWPSGRTVVVEGPVAADRSVTFVEGERQEEGKTSGNPGDG